MLHPMERVVQALYIRGLLISMGFDPEGWTPLYEDNNACIKWGNNVIGGREASSTQTSHLRLFHRPCQGRPLLAWAMERLAALHGPGSPASARLACESRRDGQGCKEGRQPPFQHGS
jgi:hypothetical protein